MANYEFERLTTLVYKEALWGLHKAKKEQQCGGRSPEQTLQQRLMSP